MNNEIKTIEYGNVEDVITEVETAFFDIPFGQSQYQTRAFALAAQMTPERRYRTIGLQLLTALKTVRFTVYQKELFDINRAEKLEKLKMTYMSPYDKQRLVLELDHELSESKFQQKLMNDTIQELNFLYAEFKKLPSFTRAQFEAAEPNYYKQSLERQIRGITGPVDAMINMNEDLSAIEEYTQKVSQLENLDDAILADLRLSMPNQIDKVLEREKQAMIEQALANKV